MTKLKIKICGISTPETVDAVVAAGADLIGFVFHPKSPRFVSAAAAALLMRRARYVKPTGNPAAVRIVALMVDPDQPALDAMACDLAPDVIQLHGTESPAFVAAALRDPGLPVLKAIGVAAGDDLAPAAAFAATGATLLIDAKPPRDAAYPGGHGRPFDWSILRALDPATPFLLSGGLTPENVGGAIQTVRGFGLNLVGVDVSSGVESAPGVKDVAKIRAFVAAARAAG